MFLALRCITERINRCPRSVTRLFFNQLDVTKIMTCVSKALAQTAFVLVGVCARVCVCGFVRVETVVSCFELLCGSQIHQRVVLI